MTDYMDNTTNAEFIPTIVAKKALGKFGSYINLAKTVARDTDLVTQQEGDTINVPILGNVTANQKTAGVDVTVQDPTATKAQVTLDSHYEVTFGIEDVTRALSNQEVMDKYARSAAIALADQVEGALAGLYADLTATPIAFDETSATTIDASLRALRKHFTDQRVPKTEQRNLYVDSDIYDYILSVDRFARYDARGGGESSEIRNGILRGVYGFDIFESQSVVETGTTPSALAHGLAYSRDAFVLATRPLPGVPDGYGAKVSFVTDPDSGLSLRTVASYDPKGLAMQLTLDILFGVAVVDQRRAVELRLTT